ncbi:MAG: phage integrase N-terminal SAM-like domain-containing protein, partial [Syntrophobacteraceae bacterium]
IEDLQLRGLGVVTQHRYVRAVRLLAEHFQKSPDKITEEELREYFSFPRSCVGMQTRTKDEIP